MKSLVIIFSVLTLSAALKDVDIHSVEHLLGIGAAESRASATMPEGLGASKMTPPGEDNKEFWLELARVELRQRVEKSLNTNKAKNVIFFLGDGMSLTTATAARIRKGQLKGRPGEEELLSFEKFPYAGLSRTYCANAQVPDSACTSTAYQCGVKANIVTLGVSAHVRYNNCTESMNPANHVSSISSWAQKAGKSTGFITTTTLTHASPAGGYAHAANRFWECDADITNWTNGEVDTSSCMDIAQQLVNQEPGSKFDIMLGGGMGKFLPNTIVDSHGKKGERKDGKNLLSLWQAKHKKGRIVVDRAGLLGLDLKKVDTIMGLFQSGVMQYHNLANENKQPTLEEMTEVAINFLSQNKNGYFIFIEGGLIDYGNHANVPGLSIDETLEFEKAIQKARDMTNPEDTLIVVTADHSHPLSFAGYPGRGTDILGLNKDDVDVNGMRYATLNYAAGTQQYLDEHGTRLNLEDIIDHKILATHPSYIKMDQGVHGGDDVGVYASGPYEHLFRGVLQQSSLPHLMAYAACIGNGATVCNKKNV